MNNLTLRIISAVCLAAGAFSLVAYSLSTRYLVLLFFIGAGAWEFSKMANIKWNAALPSLIQWMAPGAVVLLLWPQNPWYRLENHLPLDVYYWGVILVAVFALVLAAFKYLELAAMAPWLFAQFTTLGFFGYWVKGIFSLFHPETGLAAIGPFFLVILCMTAADSGGYFVGKRWGKHKLSPQISPKKTREGLFGGVLLTVLFLLVLGPVITRMNLGESALFGLVLALTAVMGDLFISAYKRSAGVKDAGQLIPGHGGIMDRFDSLFFSLPFATLLLKVFEA